MLLEADRTRAGLPRHVQRELQSYLLCGSLAHGFARVHCDRCGKDSLVASPCKVRGFCASCGGSRMAESAAHLVDHVRPDVPVRQWALTLPWRLRFLLATSSPLCRAVNVVQRFGLALNLNVHFHALVLDGVYTAAPPGHARSLTRPRLGAVVEWGRVFGGVLRGAREADPGLFGRSGRSSFLQRGVLLRRMTRDTPPVRTRMSSGAADAQG